VSGTSRKAIELTKEMLSHVMEPTLKYGVMMDAKTRSTEYFKRGIEALLNQKQLEWE
jgi:hypothetical protein